MDTTASPNELLSRARAGSPDDLGRLLEAHRHYLKLLARLEVGRNLQAKVDASDLVQDTLMEAHRNFTRFEGTTGGQFVVWLRQIMAASLANLCRRYLGTQGRDVRREMQIAAQLDQSSRLMDGALADSILSPSQDASRREEGVRLAEALASLPPDYEEVIVLRHLQGLTFPEVSQQMGRSLDSVQKLWMRALLRLRQTMGETP